MKPEYRIAFITILLVILSITLVLFFVSALSRKQDNLNNYFQYEKRYTDSLYKILIEVRKERIEVIKSIDNLKLEIDKTDREIKERITKLKFNNDKAFTNWNDSSSSALLDALLPR